MPIDTNPVIASHVHFIAISFSKQPDHAPCTKDGPLPTGGPVDSGHHSKTGAACARHSIGSSAVFSEMI
jgi:hypothetical protein